MDYFKQVNDQFGRLIGEQLLKVFADWVKAELRQTRFGLVLKRRSTPPNRQVGIAFARACQQRLFTPSAEARKYQIGRAPCRYGLSG